MTINASARNYHLTVNGTDYTSLLSSCDGGYSHYESGSGLSLISASLVLQKVAGNNINLDDRTNPAWSRGNLINLQIRNSATALYPAPVIGYLYILNAEFDGANTLKIEAGCILNLLNFRTPAGSGIYFKLGSLIDLNSVASALLTKAGVPSFSVNINGNPLKAPVPKLTNESYIQFFGKLCWANGFIAYQDNLGVVKAKKVDLLPSPSFSLSLGNDDIKYGRLTGAEHPCEKIIVTGTINLTRQNLPISNTITERFGLIPGSYSQSLMERIIYTETVDASTRITSSTTKSFIPHLLAVPGQPMVLLGLILAKQEIKIKYYELPTNPQILTGLIDSLDPDEGRLIKSESFTLGLSGIVLSEFFANKPDYGGNAILVQEKEEILYNYPPQPIDLADQPGTIAVSSIRQDLIVTTNKYQPQGVLYNDPPDSDPSPQPFMQKFVEQSVQSWLQLSEDEWQEKTTTDKAFASFPNALENFEATFGYPASKTTMFQLRPDEVTITKGRSEQLQPPSPDRWSPGYSIKEKPCKVTELFPPLAGNVYRDREREYVVDNFLTSKDQARDIAKIEGGFLHGRHKGIQCSIALRDELLNASPLLRVDWIELSGIRQAYLVDGLSVALTPTQFAISFDGVWLGTTGVGGVGIAPPYQVVNEILGSEGVGGNIIVIPYGLISEIQEISGGEGVGGNIITTMPPTIQPMYLENSLYLSNDEYLGN